MSSAARLCPDCSSELPETSRFCPSCGARTPQHTVAATGEMARTPPYTSGESAHRERLQRALGPGWQITRLIGRGGFAEVYAVLDVNLRREVAVKTLRHDLELSPQMIQRFRREAESVARLRHPNIVPIYQVGEGEGLVYFVMPVIEGESLATALQRDGAFPIGETCRILREVAGALGAAHRTGVVHRDVKPDNIMLEGPERRAVVMDFGIAKLADAAEARLTGTGLLIGSPHYMSPEQAAGESELDRRSDEYSLAVVAFQMLAGRMPFESSSVQSILFKQMTETPPPVAELRADVPPALSDAIAKALSKKREDRFQSMEEFAAALPALESGGGASVRRVLDPRTRATMARETIIRWRIPALIAGVLGVIGTWAAFRMTEPPPAIAVAASRSGAMFAARAAMPALKNGDLHTALVNDDSVYRFIYAAVGSRSVADTLAANLGAWRWTVTDASPPAIPPEIQIGAAGRIVAEGTLWPDTAKRPTITSDSARLLALPVLQHHGWSADTLHFAGDSVVQHGARTDHVLKWNVSAPVLAARDGRTAIRQVRVQVAGDTANFYRESVIFPPIPRHNSTVVRESAIGLATLLSCALAVLAVVLMVRRSRIDELQWRPILVLTAVFGIPALLYTAASAASKDQTASSAFLIFILFGVCGAFLLLPGVAAESVLSERRPWLVSGLSDLSHGRAIIPELATAALVGYPVALCLRACNGLALVVEQSIDGRAALGELGSILAAGAPALSPFVSLGIAWCTALLIAFGLAALSTWRVPRVLTLLGPALLTLVFMVATSAHGADMATTVIDVLVLTLVLWRFGVLATVVSMFVLMSLEGLVTMFVAAGTTGLAAALLAAALVAVPGVIGIVAHRRIRTSALA